MSKVYKGNQFPLYITVLLMWVILSILESKVPPLRRQVTPYLPTLSRLGILQGEAGNRTQSVVKQAGNNTGVNGEMAGVNKSLKSVSSKSYNLNNQCRLHPLYFSQNKHSVAAISEKRIGKVDCPKPSKQSKERNE